MRGTLFLFNDTERSSKKRILSPLRIKKLLRGERMGNRKGNPAGLQDCLPWGLSESELKQRKVNGNWKWGNKRISVDIILEFINYLIAYENRIGFRVEDIFITNTII